MASEILGLFGGKNPQQLQQDYLSGLMVSPAQMGSQGLLQQLISTGANAGAMMGYGGGRLLGGKVAGEVEASYIDEAVKAGNAVKGTPAEKMQAVADSLADKPGMGKQYLMALNEARKLKAEDMTMEEAKFNAENRTKDFYVKVTKFDSNGQPYETTEKQTFRWSKETNSWEPFEGSVKPSSAGETGGAGGGGDKEKEAKLAALAKKRAEQVGEGPNQTQAESERLLGKKPPAPRVPEAPFSGSGIQGAEPEAIPSPNEQPMTFPSAAQQPASPVQMTPQQMQQAGVPAAMIKQVVDYQTLVDTVKRMQQAGVDTTAIERELSLRYKRLKDLGLVK
jgi:hypothetical protein